MEKFALKILVKNSPIDGYYMPLKKSARWQPGKVKNDLPVDRPVDHPTVIFLTVVPPVDRLVDRAQPVSRPPG